jgi:hypothetical protein
MEVLDALGNPIILGNSYGYSMSKNGFHYITIGIAKKITGKDSNKVSLEITSRKEQIYMNEPTIKNDLGKDVAMNPFLLFPVNL